MPLQRQRQRSAEQRIAHLFCEQYYRLKAVGQAQDNSFAFPLTQRDDLDRSIGLRHRAGMGLSEESDTIALVVSEESGQVSICHLGVIERNLNVERFRKRLSQLLLREEQHAKSAAAQLEGETGLPASGRGPVVSHSPKSGSAPRSSPTRHQA